jgi:hypothetical protein
MIPPRMGVVAVMDRLQATVKINTIAFEGDWRERLVFFRRSLDFYYP